MDKYQPQDFEKKWIKTWDKEKTYITSISKEKDKKYVLDMFPYPSGAGLHVGHPRGYTASDILSRFYRMNNYDVLHPMGWDAFGLPAENAAIKAKKNPMDIVPQNIANFKRQMKMLGLSYDWDRELATTDPNYYGITQWLFIQFFKWGLLYKKETAVYFCPVCMTGLAEEEVMPNGTHERCGNVITRKSLPQWIFRITTYADSLLDGLKGLDWPKGILEMQKNWIGKKEGINITYPVINSKQIQNSNDQNIIDKITVFTTRPDTNFGATFIVLAPEHEFVKKISNPKVKDYVKKSLAKTDLERIAEGRKKTGVFTGFYAVNKLNGRLMPIWISDFVLIDFGTGAVVGVPGHDIRDFEFAQEFGLDIIRVVTDQNGDSSPITKKEQVQEAEGTMVNSDFLNGMDIHQATQKIMEYLEEKGYGKITTSYHLRDWIFSRQRYWGEPIPMIYCKKCADSKISYFDLNKSKNSNFQFLIFKKNNQNTKKLDQILTKRVDEIKNDLFGWFPLEENQLPLKLPYIEYYEPTETGESPLANVKNWVNTKCPNCGGEAKRETDTMPNWAGSCWYFLAFAFWQKDQTPPKDLKDSSAQESIHKWLPVDWYLGGAEHAVLHLLYARFWMHILNDMGLIDFREPFLRLRSVGMVLAGDHKKMSKSLGNVINPDEVVAEYGADALRLYEMFMAPFSQEISWSVKTLQGTYRFLTRIWQMCHSTDYVTNSINDEDITIVAELQSTIKKVSQDITNVKYNTAISSMMEFVNFWQKKKKLSKTNVKKFLQILAPFAPFTTEELWHKVFQENNSIHLSNWPEISNQPLIQKQITIPIQVQGKLRGTIVVSPNELEEEKIIKKALELEQVCKWLKGKKYRIVYIKGKILNFILT